jgi:hypothetical protein
MDNVDIQLFVWVGVEKKRKGAVEIDLRRAHRK